MASSVANKKNKIVLTGIISMQPLSKMESNSSSNILNGDKLEGAVRKGLINSKIKQVDTNSKCCQIIFNKIDEVLNEYNSNIIDKVKQSFIENYNGSISTTLGKAFKSVSSQVENTNEKAQDLWSKYATEIMKEEIEKNSNDEKNIFIAPPPKVAQTPECIEELKEILGDNSKIVYLKGAEDMNSFLIASLTTSVFTNHYNNMKEILLKHYSGDKYIKELIDTCGKIILLKKNDKLEMEAKFELFKLLAKNPEAENDFKLYIENQLKSRNKNVENTLVQIGGKVEVLNTKLNENLKILKPEYTENDKMIMAKIAFAFINQLKRETESILKLN